MINPGQVRILIVDDEPSIRELLATRFSIFGFQTVLAESGHQAWKIISEDPTIKILITDLSMPGMNGQELIEKCKNANPEVPRIFAITGHPEWSVELLYALGAEGVLHKPFDARNLLSITRNSLLSFAERLRYPPYITAAADIKLKYPHLSATAKQFAVGRGGFYLSSKEPVPPVGQIIRFDLELADLQLQGNGVVRWSRSEDNSEITGVEFVYLTAKSIQDLQQWLVKNPTRGFIPSPQSASSLPSMAKLQSTG